MQENVVKSKKNKYKLLAEIVERRIHHGDYSLKPFPSERTLASEASVSTMTARLALKHLVNVGLLENKENGRVAVAQEFEHMKKKTQIAFLAPAFSSNAISTWQFAVDRVAEKLNCNVRPVYYVHWDDPIIEDTLNGFDGVLLVPDIETSERIIVKFQSYKRPLAVIGSDWSNYCIPSIILYVPECIYQMLDYIETLGHRQIDCLNVNLVSTASQARINHWNIWRAVHRCEGELINDPVNPFEWGIEKARVAICNKIKSGQFNATALFCTGEHAAIGAIRAISDCGLRVGKDISVFGMNDEGFSKFLTPSLTSFNIIDEAPYLSACFDWIINGGKEWVGPLVVKPKEVTIFVTVHRV